jgi:hypothetical protein
VLSAMRIPSRGAIVLRRQPAGDALEVEPVEAA